MPTTEDRDQTASGDPAPLSDEAAPPSDDPAAPSASPSSEASPWPDRSHFSEFDRAIELALERRDTEAGTSGEGDQTGAPTHDASRS